MPAPARAVRLALSGLALAFVFACAASYCGAPCDKPHRPGDPAGVHVNQYGSLFGYLEVDSLGKAQLDLEKNSLEFLLKADPKDAEILAALKAEGDSAYAFRYEDYSVGGSRFDASGKLRRQSRTEAGRQRIARLIGESQSRELFERYRQVRWRLIQRERSEALAAPAPAPAETLWTGAYRADAEAAVAAPEKFPAPEACAEWALKAAEAFRAKAYAFAYECRQGAVAIRRKVW